MKISPLPIVFAIVLSFASAASAQVYIISTGNGSERRSDENRYSSYRQPETIGMEGTAEIQVVPDLIDLHFEILVRDHDFESARKDQGDRSTKVLAALRAAGVKDADLQASQIKIQSKYKTELNQDTAAIDYFQISQDFNCTLHDPAQVTPVTSAVITAGATEVSEAKLRTSKLREYRDQARHKAAVAAREKAAALAGEIGKKLGKAVSISESGGSYRGASQNNFNAVATVSGGSSNDDGQSNFAPGLIPVSATVSVTYVLEE